MMALRRSQSQQVEGSRAEACPARTGLEGPEVLHVLIADDDVNTVSALSSLLEDEGFRTFAATSADRALGCCAGELLHVALIDAIMPGTSGLQLLRRLRDQHPALPVVLISGQVPSHPEIAEALELPWVVYMPKPIDLPELGRIMGELTGRASVL